MKRTATQSSVSEAFKQFETLAHSVVHRMYHQLHANAALFRLIAAHAEYRLSKSTGSLCTTDGCAPLLSSLGKLQPVGIKILDAEDSESGLIKAVTLFDSFLTDLTRFLFLLNPGAIPKDRTVRVHEILPLTSRTKILDAIIDRHVYELAYRSLDERVAILTEKFGVPLKEAAGLLSDSMRFAEIRHSLVHDVAIYKYASAPRGRRVRVRPRRHTVVTWDEAEKATKTLVALIDLIYAATCRHVFKREPRIVLSAPGENARRKDGPA